METEAHHRNMSCVLNYALDIKENVYQKRDTKNIVDYISTTLDLYIHSYPNCISVGFYNLANCAPHAKLRVSPPEILTGVMKRIRDQTFLSMTVF